MMRNIVCFAVVLVVADLYLTSGRFVNYVPNDRLEDAKDKVSVGDELTALEDESLDSGVTKNSRNLLNHLIPTREKRKAVKDSSRRWTNNEIPFEIDYFQFNKDEVQIIYDAMYIWQHHTCLRFRPRETHDRNFVKFMKGEFCYSTTHGMNGGQQNISLPQVCFNRQSTLHEIGHAIGFYHEHKRPDRDQYITVHEENIEDKFKYAFEKSNEIETYGLPYDYTSIMHYPWNAFSKNNEITIQTKDPSFQNIIGQTQDLSYYDIQLANLMYNCR
ncbi:unnamed protein product [Candidula unifasciata]|uniref:Metalloendopeptidase n=1 Tax=Candidula unifasciata TaxID=100452 RepID=A0A8S3Z901_9EUPU|nr:unnamed protein product [Candidula unifasciata]